MHLGRPRPSLGLVQFAHNSYTTNAWPFAVPNAALASLPSPLRVAAKGALAFSRALAPLHVAHGYGVFTPIPPRHCGRQRRVMRLHASFDGGVTWPVELPQRYNATGCRRQALDFFAPHQPRLDHHLFYEAMEIPLQHTTLIWPYFAASAPLVDRLACRLLQGEPHVTNLLDAAGLEGRTPNAICAERLWVRFATPAERAAQPGRVWVPDTAPPEDDSADRSVEMFTPPSTPEPRRGAPAAPTGAPRASCAHEEAGAMRIPPLGTLAISGFWASFASPAEARDLGARSRTE